MNREVELMEHAIEFAEWMHEECFQSIVGYCLYDLSRDNPYGKNEFSIRELYEIFILDKQYKSI